MTANMEFTNFIEIYLTFYLKDDVWDNTKDPYGSRNNIWKVREVAYQERLNFLYEFSNKIFLEIKCRLC